MRLDLDSIRAYTSAFGSPLYLFDEDAFVENYHRFASGFTSRYGNYRVSYSYKTNYAPYICRLVKGLGAFAEVVSDMELQIARKAGNADDHIVYNGPAKGPLMEEFLLHGGMVNVDHREELERVLSFAQQVPERELQIGLRVNIDIGQNFISRFGIDESDLGAIFERVGQVGNVRVSGLHCHIGRSRTKADWEKRTEIMLGLADLWFEEAPAYISLGSGMFGEMDPFLASQFGAQLPTYEDYAEAVAVPFARHYREDRRPILFTEPGTTLINKYICFIAQVVAVKHIKGKTFVVLNGSKHNLGEICELKQLPIQVIRAEKAGERAMEADLVGYTCLEHDRMFQQFTGEIAPGDYIVFGNVGGYSNVSKPPFIKPNCAMVSSNGNLIKRAESVEDVICTYE